jgi:ABC-type multidrug transport system fused ATPase/permease subunit
LVKKPTPTEIRMKKELEFNNNKYIITECWNYYRVELALQDEGNIPWYIENFIQYEIYDDFVSFYYEPNSQDWASPNYDEVISYKECKYGEDVKDIRLYKMREIINLKNREVNLDAHNITKEMFNRWIKCSLVMNVCVLIQNGILYGWLIYNVICRGMTIGNFSLYLGILMAFSNNVVQCFDVIADTKRASLEIDDYRSFVELEEQTNSGVDIIENIDFDKYEFVFENVIFLHLDGIISVNFSLLILFVYSKILY